MPLGRTLFSLLVLIYTLITLSLTFYLLRKELALENYFLFTVLSLFTLVSTFMYFYIANYTISPFLGTVPALVSSLLVFLVSIFFVSSLRVETKDLNERVRKMDEMLIKSSEEIKGIRKRIEKIDKTFNSNEKEKESE